MKPTIIGGKLVTNYDIDATAGGLWTSTTVYQATVPANKRWYVYGGVINRDTSATLQIDVYDASAGHILRLYYGVAGTGISPWPVPLSDVNNGIPLGPFVLEGGMYIRATFGAAQGVAAYASCLVLEVDV